MTPSPPALSNNKTFVVLVVAVTLAFALILWPFYAAVFWAAVLAIVFSPLNRRLQGAMHDRRSLAALVTVTIIVFIVILPAGIVAAMLVQEAASLYERLQTGELDIAGGLKHVMDAIPSWARGLLEDAGLSDLASVQEQLMSGLAKGAQFIGTQALNIGQITFDFVIGFFVMLYLLFFFLRDGRWLVARINAALPLEDHLRHRLGSRFTTVVRATVKGNIVVAVLQGALGGLIFWSLGVGGAVLWAVLMALLSLLPAVGSALVWLPVAIYFLVSGAVWEGGVLIVFGVLVIGMVDNILRPILVGKDTRMPDYVILVSTLGGMAIFGLNGFVIGPLVAAMFMAVWDTVAAARAEDSQESDAGAAGG
jgi:predicted PurR-regulated permease PerM